MHAATSYICILCFLTLNYNIEKTRVTKYTLSVWECICPVRYLK